MASFTLCIGSSGRSNRDAAANWQALGLEQLVFGESGLPPTPLRRVLPEVRTTALDQPCLADALAQAAELASHPWLLLLDGDALQPWRAPGFRVGAAHQQDVKPHQR